MLGNLTSVFEDPDEYRLNFRELKIALVINASGQFQARLTFAMVGCFRVLRAWEDLPRAAFLSFPGDRIFASFPTRPGAPQFWGGVELSPGDIIFHKLGGKTHHRTSAASHWGLLSMTVEDLACWSKVLNGASIPPPTEDRILRPSPSDAVRLLYLHAEAARLVETSPDVIGHPEVVRSLEQEMIEAMVNCFAGNQAPSDTPTRRRHANVMVQLEEKLEANPKSAPRLPDLCAALQTSRRTLSDCCVEFVGIPPARYSRLRRLGMVRSPLQSPPSPRDGPLSVEARGTRHRH